MIKSRDRGFKMVFACNDSKIRSRSLAVTDLSLFDSARSFGEIPVRSGPLSRSGWGGGESTTSRTRQMIKPIRLRTWSSGGSGLVAKRDRNSFGRQPSPTAKRRSAAIRTAALLVIAPSIASGRHAATRSHSSLPVVLETVGPLRAGELAPGFWIPSSALPSAGLPVSPEWSALWLDDASDSERSEESLDIPLGICAVGDPAAVACGTVSEFFTDFDRAEVSAARWLSTGLAALEVG